MMRVFASAARLRAVRGMLARAVMLGVTVVSASCSDTSISTGVQLESVQVSSTTNSVRAGTTLALSLKLLDASGKAVENVAVVWSSSDTRIATVSNSGVVTATSPGSVTIAASALGKSSTTRITVTDRDVASVQVSPTVASVRVGTTTPLSAMTLDADGATLSRVVVWSSADASIATVSATGIVSGVATGATTITATVDGKTGTAAITVTASPVATVTLTPNRDTLGVGAQATFTAQLKDAAGATLIGRNVTWNSSDAQIATVSSTGIVTALTPGAVTVSATSEGRTGTAAVVVLARLASTVTLTPSNATFTVGTTLQLVSQITDPAGNVLTDRPITFTSGNALVAVVNSAGLVTAVSTGTVIITATSEGKVGTATLTIAPLPVASVTVSPTTATLFVGSTTQLSAQAFSATGAVLAGRTVTWISGAAGIASVSSTGLVTAIAAGTAIVVGTVDGVSGTATISVRVPVIATLTVAPIAPILAIGGTVTLTATARGDTGNVITGRVVTWASGDESIAFVSSSGLLVAVKSGTTTISATSEGVIGTTVVTVR